MKCENCEIEHNGNYGSGRFCSDKCARGFSTKNRRKEINEKVSKSLSGKGHGNVKLICVICEKEFERDWKYRNQKCCSNKCSSKYKIENTDFIENLSSSLKKVYKNPGKRKRLRDIGRKGGFGKKGYTDSGTYYESLFEKEAFEYLEEKNIAFEAHKPIPNSSKVSDVYLPGKNLWIELDGIDREKKKEWLGLDYGYWLDKLKLYKDLNLKYLIITKSSKNEFYRIFSDFSDIPL